MRTEKVTLVAVVSVLSTLLLATGAPAGQSDCDEIASLLINNTTITSTNYVFPAGDLPGYCEVTATVSPETDVMVRLPDNWLGRYLHLGGGGFDGVIPSLDFTIPRTPRNPIQDGFVVVASNGGHRVGNYPDASFSADRGLTLGYATGAIYDSDVVGAALVGAYYGEPPRYKYFIGCSNGGKNGSHAAGTFSYFYDGVIAASGAYGHCRDGMDGASMSELTAKWVQVANTFPISPQKAQAVLEAQIAKCDGLDGLKDRIIADPERCNFDPAELRCSGGSTNSCLTDDEIEAINIMRSELKDASGRVIGVPYGLADPSLVSVYGAILGGGFLSMSFGTGEAMSTTSTFDFERDFPTVKTVLDDIYSMTANLNHMSDYLRKGGKLFLWHGWEDMVVPAYVSTRAYRALQESAGPKGSRNVRLYMVPGVTHCAGGAGADTADLLGAMTRWVEKGTPPDHRLIASKIDPQSGATVLTRPLCEYPEIPVYKRGDRNDASSFKCQPQRLGPCRH
jgi:feruloyl esterase